MVEERDRAYQTAVLLAEVTDELVHRKLERGATRAEVEAMNVLVKYIIVQIRATGTLIDAGALLSEMMVEAVYEADPMLE